MSPRALTEDEYHKIGQRMLDELNASEAEKRARMRDLIGQYCKRGTRLGHITGVRRDGKVFVQWNVSEPSVAEDRADVTIPKDQYAAAKAWRAKYQRQLFERAQVRRERSTVPVRRR